MHTLISAPDLLALQANGTDLVLLDCSFDLTDTSAGERAFDARHLPGAQYAHLDRDLSGPVAAAGQPSRGRHPLPALDRFASKAGAWGVAPGLRVVVYDTQGGTFAARAWWLFQWLGHAETALLDGGMAAFVAAGGTLTDRATFVRTRQPYAATVPSMPTFTADSLQAKLPQLKVVDARAPERFRGDVEPLDAVGGHIPGAINRFYKDNLQADGRFKPAAQLKTELAPLLQSGNPVVQQCGSGVTACHNLLAMVQAGLGTTALYPGSWSEWSSDPKRPMQRPT
jgi:thiosulfate/3-mercaptopyruvate sulfurtransferase